VREMETGLPILCSHSNWQIISLITNEESPPKKPEVTSYKTYW